MKTKIKVETINQTKLYITGENAVTEEISCEDISYVRLFIDRVLNRHPDWIVGKVNFTYREGSLNGKIEFSLPAKKTKNKRYLVEWREISTCWSEVEAPNKKVARQLAEENFADGREYEENTNWVVTEIKE